MSPSGSFYHLFETRFFTGTVTLAELLQTWAAHDLNHTVQAERALMQPFMLGCGTWRLLLSGSRDRCSEARGVSHVPTLTETVRGYPLLTVPRHDRAILLLIDVRRTISELWLFCRFTQVAEGPVLPSILALPVKKE